MHLPWFRRSGPTWPLRGIRRLPDLRSSSSTTSRDRSHAGEVRAGRNPMRGEAVDCINLALNNWTVAIYSGDDGWPAKGVEKAELLH